MMVDEDYEGQRVTAYHEAGHAIAASKCPDGRVKSIDICDRSKDDEENGATSASCRDADGAFLFYAGAVAEAMFWAPGRTVNTEMALTFLRANRDDWIEFQTAAGNFVGVSEWTQLQDALRGEGEPMPLEYRPPREWHEKAAGVVAAAWDAGEIQDLAEQMLAHKKCIELCNGQRLIREGVQDRWCGTDYRRAPDDGDGLVGPPPSSGM